LEKVLFLFLGLVKLLYGGLLVDMILHVLGATVVLYQFASVKDVLSSASYSS